ncbi:MAG: GNAT family N-acetyltransferase [Candidatus Aenigmarchaeota archaeon]|nr:GNAT family N-acetyltransferase [Candidatus Aenigmarchaeota archaeon]
MNIIIKKYKESDFGDLVELMEELQDFIVNIDPMKRLRRLPLYGKIYTDDLLKKIKQNQGIIFLAEHQNKVIGCVAGIIEKQTKYDLVRCKPTKPGKILELIVTKDYRSQKVGNLLMDKIEKHFKKAKCTVVYTDIFEPNKGAYKFYQKLNYKSRLIYMIKPI